MKQRFYIEGSSDKKELIIQEHSETEKDVYTLLCEESFDLKEVKTAAKQGEEQLLQLLRTQNLYPPSPIAQRLAETVVEFISSSGEQRMEMLFDDKEIVAPKEESEDLEDVEDDVSEESSELDDLLEDKGNITKISSSLKVADDEASGEDEDA